MDKKNSKKFSARFFLFFLILFFCLSIGRGVEARDLSSSSFIIRDPVIGSGGGYGSSATFQLFNSQELLFTDAASSASFIGRYGFLYFPSATSPTPTPTPTPSSSGSSSGGITVIGCSRVADLNCDNRVNLLDLSILLYYTGKTGSIIIPFDLNDDSRIDLMDISVMFYYWDSE